VEVQFLGQGQPLGVEEPTMRGYDDGFVMVRLGQSQEVGEEVNVMDMEHVVARYETQDARC